MSESKDAKGEAIAVAWNWPAEQRLSYKITPETNGLMSASSIGKQLTAIAELMEMSDDGMKWKVGIRAIYTEADGSIRFDLAIMPKARGQ